MIAYLLFAALFSTIASIESSFIINRPSVDYISEARRLVHQSNWAAVATISSYKSMNGFPIVNVLSTSDSVKGSMSTGKIYFCMMSGDLPALDVDKDNKITFLFSDAQGSECHRRQITPCGRNCARTSLSGQVRKLSESSDEYADGYEAFVSRHPNVPCRGGSPGREFNLYTLDVQKILVLLGPGGYQTVPLDDYFAYTDIMDAT